MTQVEAICRVSAKTSPTTPVASAMAWPARAARTHMTNSAGNPIGCWPHRTSHVSGTVSKPDTIPKMIVWRALIVSFSQLACGRLPPRYSVQNILHDPQPWECLRETTVRGVVCCYLGARSPFSGASWLCNPLHVELS